MTDEELRWIYLTGYNSQRFGSHDTRHDAALRAVFLAGARAQREMRVPNEVLERVGAMEGWDGRRDAADKNHRDWFHAVQAAMPLAVDPTVREDGR